MRDKPTVHSDKMPAAMADLAAAMTAASGQMMRPRPLPLHLAAAMMNSTGAFAALPAAHAGALPWTPRLAVEAADLAADMQAVDLGELQAACVAEATGRMTAMLDGITAYQRAPRRPPRLGDTDVVWSRGNIRVLDYGGDGIPVLFIPSLINRAYVLDLADDCSLMAWCLGNGIRAFLVDWGAPGTDERDLSVSDYICDRLDEAFSTVLDRVGGPLGIVGYCLGGNLALALALRRQADVFALALLATPWDFHADHERQGSLIRALAPGLDAILTAFGELPVDLLQTMFAALDPNLAERKFRRFAALDPDSAAARRFVDIEDWLNDGVPLAAPVARECLLDWYGANTPGRGQWQVGGETVDAAAWARPALLAIPASDRIVPAASARALARVLPRAELLTPASGHIGMMVGGRSRDGLWRPLTDWLGAQAALAG